MNKSKRLLYVVLFLLALICVIVGLSIVDFKSFFQIRKTNEIVSVVDRGQVIIYVEAMGVVEAENEVIILSPSSSIIKRINKEPGIRVKEGEVIVELDPEPIKKEIEDIKDQLEIKRNTLERTKLNNRSTIIDLDYNVEVKQLKITSLKSQLIDEEQLLSVGGISPARLEETRQNITFAEKDLDMVVEKNEIRLIQLRAEEEGLLLQIRIQEKQLSEKMALLDKMEVKALSDGILLAVFGKVGEKTGTDKMLVRMSDLTAFKIIGSSDEKYSEFIKTGNQVNIILDNEILPGTMGNITPVVENNRIQFYVHLENGSHPKLIANQAVRLQVVQSAKNNILRIPVSDDFYPNHEQIVYVKNSEKVVRKNVRFGIKGTEFQEIISGLNEGDRVILPTENSNK